MILKADPKALENLASGLQRRYVYVFTINSFGDMVLLYPDPTRGNEGNYQPTLPSDGTFGYAPEIRWGK